MSLSDLRSVLIADPRYQQLQRFFENKLENALNFDQLTQEVITRHETRKIRTLDLHSELEFSEYAKMIMKANVDDQVTRSRMCAIKLRLNENSNSTTQAVNLVYEYMMARYKDDFAEAELRTKEERTRIIYTLPVFEKATTHTEKLNRLWADLDIVISDIDQGGFMFRNTIQTIEMLVKRGDYSL